MQLLGSICSLAFKLCEFGFFTPDFSHANNDEDDAAIGSVHAQVKCDDDGRHEGPGGHSSVRIQAHGSARRPNDRHVDFIDSSDRRVGTGADIDHHQDGDTNKGTNMNVNGAVNTKKGGNDHGHAGDLRRLCELILDLLLHADVLNAGEDVEGQDEEQMNVKGSEHEAVFVPKHAEDVCHERAVSVQLRMLQILQFAFDVRINLRR